MSGLPIVESILSAAPDVTAITSNRIYYSTAPQGITGAYCIIVGTAEDDAVLLAGQAQFPESYISVVSYADSFPVVENLGNAVVAALADQRGVWRGRTATIQRDGGGSFDWIEATRTHRRIDNFLVRWRYDSNPFDAALLVTLFGDD